MNTFFKHFDAFYNGFAVVTRANGKQGMINRNSEVVIVPNIIMEIEGVLVVCIGIQFNYDEKHGWYLRCTEKTRDEKWSVG